MTKGIIIAAAAFMFALTVGSGACKKMRIREAISRFGDTAAPPI